MSFEGIIKKISNLIAAVAVFLLAGGWYLSMKGFVMDGNYNITLVKPAMASEGGYMSTDVPADLVLPKGQSMGKEDAPVTIYEYSSLGCAHCADFHLSTLSKIKSEYIDQGKVRLVFIDFPIDKKSMQAAMMARCVPDGKYFDMLELLFKKQREWWLASNTEKALKQYAALGGIGAENFAACLKNNDVAQEILNNRQQAVNDLKIQGTPAFIVDSKNGREMLSGAQSWSVMQDIINSHLDENADEIENNVEEKAEEGEKPEVPAEAGVVASENADEPAAE